MTKLPIPSSYAEKHKIETEKEVSIFLFHIENNLDKNAAHLDLFIDYLSCFVADMKYLRSEINESNLYNTDHGKTVSAYLFQLDNIAQLARC